MNIVKKQLSELRMPERNVRRHSDKQIAEYVRSLKAFDQVKPIVIDESGEIICGNGLFLALNKMGETHCYCHVMEGITPAQKKKLMLADNRVYELGLTDMDVFDEILRELDGDVDIPGWDEELLRTLNAGIDEADELLDSYGIFPRNEVESMAAKQRVPESAPSPIQPPPPPPPAPYSESSASPAPQASSVQQEDAAPRSFVICPHCGERICL